MAAINLRTLYIDVPAMAQLVRSVGLRPMLRQMVEALREDYSRWHDFDKSPRTANHSPVGVIELMPVSDDHHFSFKYVNGHPKNPEQGLPTVMAFGLLSEVSTGFPLLLSEMTVLTAIRTAATSAFAASLMARPNGKRMAMIGNGAQSEFQLIAFHEILGITEFTLFDTDPKATAKLVANLAHESSIKLIPCQSASEAVRGVDIVTTCTADKARAQILGVNDLEPGMHINAIGGDCPGKTELDSEILNRAHVVVEFEPQSRVEGELQQMPSDFRVTELWEVLSGRAKGRHNAQEVTVFDSVGFALEDYSALRTVLHLAQLHGVGQPIHLMAITDDVKDLFGLVAEVPAASR